MMFCMNCIVRKEICGTRPVFADSENAAEIQTFLPSWRRAWTKLYHVAVPG
jgi:hypothetical protein